MATFSTERWCPYHGDLVRLADCRIVATNQVYADRLRAAWSSTLDDDSYGPEELVSLVDGEGRLVLAEPPPPPPAQERTGIFSRQHEVELPTPAELAVAHGGAQGRPVRACPHPNCRHPLPALIDDRDPYIVAVAGVNGASKSTLITALTVLAGRLGRASELGLTEFAPTESTLRRIREMQREYIDGVRFPATPLDVEPPWEIKVDWEFGGDPGILFLHDVAGEVFGDPDMRLTYAPFVLWPDAVVFLVDPEEYELVGGHKGTDQGSLLRGMLDDLQGSREDADVPVLLVALTKADLLVPGIIEKLDEDAGEPLARAALNALGAHDVIDAADRWPEATIGLVAPQPEDGDPFHVLEIFRWVFDRVAERR